MIDRRPGLIVRCTGTADVVQAVRFARQHQFLLSVRGGGHNIAGLALRGRADDRPVPDARRLGRREGKTARAQGGCTLADLDRETQVHGLAAVLGFVSATGIGGLTVGGGFGYLTRRFGYTCDNLVSMEVVTADGKVRAAAPTKTPSCSGRCAAAAATSASSPPSNTSSTRSGPRSWAAPWSGAPRTRRRCSTSIASSPRAPARDHLRGGDAHRAARALAAGRDPRQADHRRLRLPQRWHRRRREGPGAAAHLRQACRRHRHAPALHADAEPARRHPAQGPALLLEVELPGGRSRRSACGASSTPRTSRRRTRRSSSSSCKARSANCPRTTAPPATATPPSCSTSPSWEKAADDAVNQRWARDCFAAMAPYSTGGTYINFLNEEEGRERIEAAYGGTNLERLAH